MRGSLFSCFAKAGDNNSLKFGIEDRGNVDAVTDESRFNGA